MTEYRPHFINADKSVGRGRPLDCENDRDAVHQAAPLRQPHGVDVWEGRRKVGHVAGALGSRAKR